MGKTRIDTRGLHECGQKACAFSEEVQEACRNLFLIKDQLVPEIRGYFDSKLSGIIRCFSEEGRKFHRYGAALAQVSEMYREAERQSGSEFDSVENLPSFPPAAGRTSRSGDPRPFAAEATSFQAKKYDIARMTPDERILEITTFLLAFKAKGNLAAPEEKVKYNALKKQYPQAFAKAEEKAGTKNITAWMIQYYLNEMGFDLNDKSGKPCIDGLFGVKTASALLLLQYGLGKGEVNGKADDVSTLLAVQKAARDGVKFSDIMAGMKEWKPGTPGAVQDRDNGFIDPAKLVRIPSWNCGYEVVQKETAVAWAIMVQGAIQYNRSGSVKDRIDVKAFSANDGYRSYADQVKVYAGYYLQDVVKAKGMSPKEIGTDYNLASTPKFDTGLKSAQKFILAHKDDFIKNPHYFDAFAGKPGSGSKLGGYGTSLHGKGTAIDFCTHDAGSWDNYSKKEDPLCPASLEGVYGTGESLTGEVAWLHKNGVDYGFTGNYYTSKETGICYDGSSDKINGGVPLYRETWHWYYKK